MNSREQRPTHQKKKNGERRKVLEKDQAMQEEMGIWGFWWKEIPEWQPKKTGVKNNLSSLEQIKKGLEEKSLRKRNQ